jgi:hypothetical protein
MRSSTGNGSINKAATNLAAATHYFPIDCMDDEGSSLSLVWTGGTATCTLQVTNFPTSEATFDDTSTKWQDLPITVAGPAGSAGGSFSSWGNVNGARLRLKVVVTVLVTGLTGRVWGVA